MENKRKGEAPRTRTRLECPSNLTLLIKSPVILNSIMHLLSEKLPDRISGIPLIPCRKHYHVGRDMGIVFEKKSRGSESDERTIRFDFYLHSKKSYQQSKLYQQDVTWCNVTNQSLGNISTIPNVHVMSSVAFMNVRNDFGAPIDLEPRSFESVESLRVLSDF